MSFKIICLDQDKAIHQLEIQKHQLPAALLLLGPSGVGKRLATYQLFQNLNCSNLIHSIACGKCNHCKKIFENNHTDIIEINPTNQQIAIDDLREMKKQLFFPPIESKYRFVIINDAHTLNLSSSNALLKTLEEPPEHTRFFLITHERSLIMPTILSRCQYLYFAPLHASTINDFLENSEIKIPEQHKDFCIAYLSGGLGRMAEIQDPKLFEHLDRLHQILNSKNNISWESITRFADELGNDDFKIQITLDYIIWLEHSSLVNQTLPIKQAIESKSTIADMLKNRLKMYANKKLIALSTSNLIHS